MKPAAPVTRIRIGENLMRIRVIRAIARLNIGGPAWNAVLLSAGTRARYPTLLAIGSTGSNEADGSDLAHAHGVEVVRVPGLGREITWLGDLRGSAEKIRVIPLGFDLGRFVRADQPAARRRFRAAVHARDDQILVTMVGRLTAIKNHALVMRALAAIDAATDVVLVLVGGGEDEPRLRALAQTLGIESRVRFAGWWRDLEAVYYGSDIVALSSDNEGTPVCLIEALACGRAVVATDVGGV